MKQILIGVNNKIYDVTKYIPYHPGEGIVGSYLKKFDRKDCTKEFNRLHLTNEPDDLLNLAGSKENCYINYVSSYFKFSKLNRIPKYYYYIKTWEEVREILKKELFILYPFDNTLKLSYNKEDNIITSNISLIDGKYTIIVKNIVYQDEYIDYLIKKLSLK